MKNKINLSNCNVEFKTENVLHICVTTPRLLIRSTLPEDVTNCIQLLSDPIVMQKFMTGTPWEEKTTRLYHQKWISRWQQGDPFSVYTILHSETSAFIGILGLGHFARGISEISF